MFGGLRDLDWIGNWAGRGAVGGEPAVGLRSLVRQGVAAAKAGEKAEARSVLELALRLDEAEWDLTCRLEPRERSDAFVWLSEISEHRIEKRHWLELALAHDPASALARRKMAILEGRLKPEDIIDADRLGAPTEDGLATVEPERFVCPRCGGRMAYTPDGRGLSCDYCTWRESLAGEGESQGLPAGGDFVVGMAKASGHLKPATAHTFACGGCGVRFVLGPQTLSVTCPHCGSVYVVEQVESRELVVPTGIIPFHVARERAEEVVRRWLADHHVEALPTPPLGVYLPVWSFDLSGQAPWSVGRSVGSMMGQTASESSGDEIVLEKDLLVAASETSAGLVEGLLAGYRLEGLEPYDPGYLADWPAETYTRAMSNAALEARWRTLGKVRARVVEQSGGRADDLVVKSSRFTIDSFRLLLVPLWVSRCEAGGLKFEVAVNGQTGEGWSDGPPRARRRKTHRGKEGR